MRTLAVPEDLLRYMSAMVHKSALGVPISYSDSVKMKEAYEAADALLAAPGAGGGWEASIPEDQCSAPSYRPGDIFETDNGQLGVVESAQVTINGGVMDWSSPLPEVITHGGTPSYSATSLPGYKIGKHAWWQACEWRRVWRTAYSRNGETPAPEER